LIVIFGFSSRRGICNLNFTDLEHFTMNTPTGPDPQPLTIASVYTFYPMIMVVFLAFPFFLKVHAHLQGLLMYYYIDPLDDQYYLVDQHQRRYSQNSKKGIFVNQGIEHTDTREIKLSRHEMSRSKI